MLWYIMQGTRGGASVLDSLPLEGLHSGAAHLCCGSQPGKLTHSSGDMQGREADVVIFSAVRSNSKLGFVSDPRRMNVALSRPRR